MKIASLTVAYNEEEVIGGCLSLLQMDKLVIIPIKTFSGQRITKRDRTEQIAKACGAKVVYVDLDREYECRNYGLGLLRDYDYALIVDADEYWPLETQKRIINLLDGKAYKAKMDFFFKQSNWQIVGNHNWAVVAIRTDERFSSKRPRQVNGAEMIDIGKIYHFAYVRTPEKIKEKIEAFSHATEIIPNWYENVFMKFTPEMKDFHPVNPKEYPRCKVVDLPEEISQALNK
ncbi:MAG TPA: hypothetical protein DCY12_05990 [Candidatus Atribacteria bacterium]|nr:hypothetical protein [Candidatus Atribacteria bacterium]